MTKTPVGLLVAAAVVAVLTGVLMLLIGLLPSTPAPATPPPTMPTPGAAVGYAGAHAAIRAAWELQ